MQNTVLPNPKYPMFYILTQVENLFDQGDKRF